MSRIGTVASLHRFPVKSMQGESPVTVELDANGIVGDRSWAVRDTGTGKLVSAKRPRLWRSMLDCTATGTGDDVSVTLPSGETHRVNDPALPPALGALFGRSVALEASTGPMQGTYESDWPDIEGLSLSGEVELPTNLTGEGTSFVDLGVLHVLTTASLQSLAAAAPDVTVDVRRFRPSILLDTPGLAGYPENDWAGRRLIIGDAVVALGDPAPRCVMTTVAQPGLAEEPGVLRAVAAENKRSNDLGTFACLGCYASVETPGTVDVGAPVTLS